ncbi:MAG: hypothetical protein WBZ33_13400, partial [Thermoactinomyces sp.]
VQPGQIWDQKPRNGTMVKNPSSTKVTLYVAPKGVKVKSFYGKFESSVHQSEVADLPYKVELWRCSDPEGSKVGHARIYKQEPEAGSYIAKGGTVKVYSYIETMPGCQIVPGW